MEEFKGMLIHGTKDLVERELLSLDSSTEEDKEAARLYDAAFSSSLAGHIKSIFETNKRAKRESGIEDELFKCLRSYNGQYDPKDLELIRADGGSEIYMNLTATKCRAASSWIGDILLSKEKPFALEPTPIPELPSEVQDTIKASIDKEWDTLLNKIAEEGSVDTKTAQRHLKEVNQTKRDIEEAVMEEIMAEAKWQIKKMETEIHDQLIEGEWGAALEEFIEDFTIFPTAFMKGPIITKQNKLSWVNGQPTQSTVYKFINKRVSPFDIYPSPSANKIWQGNLVEDTRFSRKEIYDLIGVPGYDSEKIKKVLEQQTSETSLFTDIEQDKAEVENKGSALSANKDIIHGLHFFGYASCKLLREWGLSIPEYEDSAELDIEAVVVGDEVIKVSINDDPLSRRPYYAASYQNTPGSVWGRALPNLMRDIARMCNATARALANNMGISSGPQIEVYTDRLADNGPIEAIRPLKIWQLTSDPTGAGGRAISFFQPTSNAAELLAVYKDYEARADDATGIPRYAYGNEKVGGAAQTASGLSMLLDSATKSIKAAIRHIDTGLIKPRIELQFYWNLKSKDDSTFTGDITVVPRGSLSITIKGAEQLRRNEFLNITSNAMDMQIMGLEGRASVLREMAKDIGFINNPIPSRLELKEKEEQAAEAAKNQPTKEATSIEAVKIQTQGVVEMAKGSQELKARELELKQEKQDSDVALKAQAMAMKRDADIARDSSRLKLAETTGTQKDTVSRRRDAVTLRKQEMVLNAPKQKN